MKDTPEKKKISFEAPSLDAQELTQALYETTLKLNETNIALKESHKIQQDMFLHLSHDLRAPISTIKGTLESLLIHEPESYEAAKPSLQLMERRITQLETLVNNILLLSKLDGHYYTPKLHVLNAGMFLEEIYYMFEADPIYGSRCLSLDVPLDFDFPVNIDPEMFQMVFDNLFYNAYKFTNEGDKIILSASQKDSEHIQIQLTDTGIGIPKEHVPFIFNRTYMVDDARTPNAHVGNGLGLSIIRSIVEYHQGTVSCESQYGSWTTFTICLPIQQ